MPEEFTVPYHGQGSLFDEADIAAVSTLLRSGVHLSSGVERAAFEADFAAATGAAHAVTTTSCTMSLHLATHLLGLREGDEVIASPLTFQATVAPLLGRPGTVRFADIDPGTLALCAESVERLVTPRTRAIYVTHYGGLAADLEPLVALAETYGLTLVEDCAHALGTRYRGRPVGVADLGCWSFHSLKNISTLGQGGMVTTTNAAWADTLREIREIDPDADFVPRERPTEFGSAPPDDAPVGHEKNAYTHDCTEVRTGGYNAVMAEPAAAVGRTQLRKLPDFVKRRRAIAEYLHERLGRLPGIELHQDTGASEHAYHLYTFRVVGAPAGTRDELIRRLLNEHRIEIVQRYFPLHLLPEWRARGGEYGQCPVAERVWFSELVNLPLYPALTDDQVTHLADSVETTLRRLAAPGARPARGGTPGDTGAADRPGAAG